MRQGIQRIHTVREGQKREPQNQKAGTRTDIDADTGWRAVFLFPRFSEFLSRRRKDRMNSILQSVFRTAWQIPSFPVDRAMPGFSNNLIFSL